MNHPATSSNWNILTSRERENEIKQFRNYFKRETERQRRKEASGNEIVDRKMKLRTTDHVCNYHHH